MRKGKIVPMPSYAFINRKRRSHPPVCSWRQTRHLASRYYLYLCLFTRIVHIGIDLSSKIKDAFLDSYCCTFHRFFGWFHLDLQKVTYVSYLILKFFAIAWIFFIFVDKESLCVKSCLKIFWVTFWNKYYIINSCLLYTKTVFT